MKRTGGCRSGAASLTFAAATTDACSHRHRQNAFLCVLCGACGLHLSTAHPLQTACREPRRELDRRVERTRLRPLASRRVGVRAAWVLIGLLFALGLLVLAQLNWVAAMIALASLAPVAVYPFMKRITWWPQAWLGVVFSWGALVGWPAVSARRSSCC